jgi:RES domain-containing protein
VTPLPAALGGAELVAWRIDPARYAATWDSGQGAYLWGGRWNSPGVRAVYCSLDPATAIVEVAVHTGFRVLDTEARVLTALTITVPARVHVLEPADMPNRNWLVPGIESAGQQEFGDRMLGAHTFVVLPSAVSSHSWNLMFVAPLAAGAYAVKLQEPFALDTRLHPARPPARSR